MGAEGEKQQVDGERSACLWPPACVYVWREYEGVGCGWGCYGFTCGVLFSPHFAQEPEGERGVYVCLLLSLRRMFKASIAVDLPVEHS